MTNILGIGVDIADVKRFKQFETDRKHSFLQRVFTPSEIEYCFGEASPAEHLAGRFAGKEAMVKALAVAGRPALEYKQIEILNSAKGIPTVRFIGLDLPLSTQISLSHTSDVAIAMALISQI